ncbi:alpha-amylase family glycosyl hydrolase [Spirochaeta africana]|uniref:Glycosidase n=1 Tax=Spirochaeta africana (strain ATCC 700263 / DSM 8902 / Z-7692) TaxID=889378 RepID=H9UFB6_SPIAZ|nr:alpha-amylase family glycosyl hydrolase [Spirochaeta africana]AFG36209.1 glycosidase [Spirochaeta africana DSM 8902]
MLRPFHIRQDFRAQYDPECLQIGISSEQSMLPGVRTPSLLAYEINRSRDIAADPARAVSAGEMSAMALLDEIYFYLIGLYREQYGEEILRTARQEVQQRLGKPATAALIESFAETHPPAQVFKQETSCRDFLESRPNPADPDETGRDQLFTELMLVYLEQENPALANYREIFDVQELQLHHGFDAFTKSLHEVFAELPSFGPENELLIDMLRMPAQLFPESLFDQLAYIRRHWGSILGSLLERLLRAIDKLSEERKARGFVGGGSRDVLSFGGLDEEAERFSMDRDWMPRVVLIAKSTLVWLDQLSRWYDREIRTLNQIPDQELDQMASRGITGLWLIGLWQRSPASKEIKNLCGNPDAEASAYSLLNYEIADSLGGWDAVANLRHRCAQRGIRLASDMVPNHTGIDSDWVEQHPDWFVQLSYPPFPGYSFTGKNLSRSPHLTVQIEDHYYDRTDASVVFKRTDNHSGDTRYIYHGNDGTHMPWNDTAQLDFLNPEVREAVIQTILHVARNFPIIRFDAAMTLAKKHIQRLWYPAPGTGGDIPSRAEHGLTREEFDDRIPEEFWREVVDRVAQELPDTLLLAEAFWMMEGYFVRTLGMHRVYNSAFMHMLKNEDNAKYRQTIKNTLEFDPDILKRFVNFMNNPDEETAVAQFGRDDKYFGVCTLMLTMPGLPMFGHGQIEGFAEKYGMEYSRAYHDEQPDQGLIARHEHDIFPLARKRYLFAEVDSFHLYDFYSSHGQINENVYAYSNSHGDERALVLYNNSYESTQGWIKAAAPYTRKTSAGKLPNQRTDLAQALRLHTGPQWFTLLYEVHSGLWFIRRSSELFHAGLFAALSGYQYQVFMNVHEVEDTATGLYSRLHDRLGGSGTPDINRAVRDLYLEPVHAPMGWACHFDAFAALLRGWTEPGVEPDHELIQDLAVRYADAVDSLRSFDTKAGSLPGRDNLQHALSRTLPTIYAGTRQSLSKAPQAVTARMEQPLTDSNGKPDPVHTALWFCLAYLMPLTAAVEIPETVGEGTDVHPYRDAAALLLEEWELDRVIIGNVKDALGSIEDFEQLAYAVRRLLRIILGWMPYLPSAANPGKVAWTRILLHGILQDLDAHSQLGINSYDGVVYFNQEGFAELLAGIRIAGYFACLTEYHTPADSLSPAAKHLKALDSMLIAWKEAEEGSQYTVKQLIQLLDGETSTGKTARKPAGAKTGKAAAGSNPDSGAAAKKPARKTAKKPASKSNDTSSRS